MAGVRRSEATVDVYFAFNLLSLASVHRPECAYRPISLNDDRMCEYLPTNPHRADDYPPECGDGLQCTDRHNLARRPTLSGIVRVSPAEWSASCPLLASGMSIATQHESFWAILLDDLLRLMPRHQGDTPATVLEGDQRASTIWRSCASSASGVSRL